MGPYQDLEPVIEERFGLDVEAAQTLTGDDEVERTLLLLRSREDITGDESRDIKHLLATEDPREKILGLYEEYRPRLLLYLHSMYLKRDVAEEVIQETFLRLTTELLRGSELKNVQGWIVRVAHNLGVDVIKKREKDASRNADINSVPLAMFVDPGDGPEEAYQKEEKIRCLETAFTTLNPQQRQCFNLRVQGFRYKDIAQALDISEQRAAIVVKQVAIRLAAVLGVGGTEVE